LKWEGKRGRIELGAKSGKVKMATRSERVKGKSGNHNNTLEARIKSEKVE
jgi:hypothetical protein